MAIAPLPAKHNPTALIALVAFAIFAFAGNSLLARAVLAEGELSASMFTAVRLGAGAVVLFALCAARGKVATPQLRDGPGIAALFVYMAGFSLAYGAMDAASGALILFGAVQLTILAWGAVRGVWPNAAEITGAALAMVGAAYLIGPGPGATPALPALIMAAAGVGWGLYTALGRAAGDPLALTARNFIGAVPLALALLLVTGAGEMTARGIGFAIISGAVASGIGYAVWYRAVPHLSLVASGVSQLTVPPVTAIGGALLLAEPLSVKLAVASAVILSGVALTVFARR